MLVKIITKTCLSCREAGMVVIEATDDQLDRWENGELIQVVFPSIPVDVREQIISGTHHDCWNKMWK